MHYRHYVIARSDAAVMGWNYYVVYRGVQMTPNCSIFKNSIWHIRNAL